MSFVLKTAPTSDPVTLADAKIQCREDSTDNDSLITGFIKAAMEYLDGPKGILNYCLIKQSWYAYFDAFPSGSVLRVDSWPMISVDAFEYLDNNSVWQPVPSASYAVDIIPGNAWLVLATGASWPTPQVTINSVRVAFTAGYDSNNANAVVPSSLFLAVKMLVAHWYENRGLILDDRRMESLPMALDALVAKYRRVPF